MPIDADADFANIDNRETVTVTCPRAGVDPDFAAETDLAFRRPLDIRRDFTADVALTGKEIVWNIAASVMVNGSGRVELQEGDTITDGDGKVYKVLTASLKTFRSRWRAVCIESRSNS